MSGSGNRSPIVIEGVEEEVSRRGDPDYERKRAEAVWNGLKPERFPELIVRVASAEEIPQVLAHAREQGLRVSMRSGGHHWSGSQLREGALLLDLSRLQHCDVDPDSSTAVVGPAVTGRTLGAELARHRLAFPLGHSPAVALGGYLLSGGLGWNSRELGPACSYVEEIEAVTADGRTVRCSENENPDLFWAARGAGPGFFAVATRFKLRLLPHPGSIMSVSFTFPLSEADPVGNWALHTALERPPNIEVSLVLTAAARGVSGPGPRLRIAASAFAPSRQEAADALAPLANCPFASRAVDSESPHPTTFRDLYGGRAATWPPEQRYAVDTLWSPEPYETQLARSAHLIDRAPSPDSYVLVPVEPVAPDPDGLRHMAFSDLGSSYLTAFAVWDDPADDEANTRWLRQGMDALDPQGIGSHYIGEADLGAGSSRARRSFTPADWEQLRLLRERWDPTGLFEGYLTP
ncbi:FAD-binding oxidoreductase [Streptomyces sp. WMMB 322]|uniref:FAD-binding oxidoreductase n=1 Tax=Streptomyces sp. WMMB 322 TaxID=1286821 RepID=UPI0006E1587A|nr:FAD-binding oxidoreductase [Streptomyces sp. WMMB 322]SCK12290.1 FAD/FMN-containing dehydrogenase [Streptomyces sp. WMMB 322]